MPRRLLVPVALVVAALTVAGTACSGSGYRYVTSRKAGVYFKVPTEWKVFDRNDLSSGLKANGSPGIDDATLFAAGFDSAPKPSISHVTPLDAGADHPTGIARVKLLAPSERDAVSFQSLRNMLLSVDDGEQQSKVKVLGQVDLVPKGGYRGQRIVFEVAREDGSTFVVDQTTMVDQATERLFVLAVACASSCYESNRKVVDKVVTSWTVKKG
ncbi:MAG: hypothetical protein QOG64_2897, partial [Acidimicrobiaceae bacterium]|nr:hypothetical protein [Acidimicrobiaceae bacterium]